jgi:hypothetical protein
MLPVRVSSTLPGIEIRTRTHVVVRSESTQRTTELLAAFAAASLGGEAQASLAGGTALTGFDDGRYFGLVQAVAPASSTGGRAWEIGLSMVSRGAIRHEMAVRIEASAQNVPVVFESVVPFRPGPFEIVLVALDPASSLMQRAQGAFWRDGEVRRAGSLIVGEPPLIQGDRDTAVLFLVCRSRETDRMLSVRRRLVGESEVSFPPLDLAKEKGERCATLQDIIPAGTLSAGEFRFEVSVASGEEDLGTSAATFFVGEVAARE